MSRVFAEVGANLQQIGGECPDGWIEMRGPRDQDSYVAAGDGNWISPPPVVPDRITRRQGRLALLHAGYLAQAEDAMSALTDPTELMASQIEYEAETWDRANPWIERTGALIGLDTTQIDALFISAAAL